MNYTTSYVMNMYNHLSYTERVSTRSSSLAQG